MLFVDGWDQYLDTLRIFQFEVAYAMRVRTIASFQIASCLLSDMHQRLMLFVDGWDQYLDTLRIFHQRLMFIVDRWDQFLNTL